MLLSAESHPPVPLPAAAAALASRVREPVDTAIGPAAQRVIA